MIWLFNEILMVGKSMKKKSWQEEMTERKNGEKSVSRKVKLQTNL